MNKIDKILFIIFLIAISIILLMPIKRAQDKIQKVDYTTPTIEKPAERVVEGDRGIAIATTTEGEEIIYDLPAEDSRPLPKNEGALYFCRQRQMAINVEKMNMPDLDENDKMWIMFEYEQNMKECDELYN